MQSLAAGQASASQWLRRWAQPFCYERVMLLDVAGLDRRGEFNLRDLAVFVGVDLRHIRLIGVELGAIERTVVVLVGRFELGNNRRVGSRAFRRRRLRERAA